MSSVEKQDFEMEASVAVSVGDVEEETPVETEGPTLYSKIFKALLVLGVIAYSIAAFALDFERAKPLFLMEISALALYSLSVILTRFSEPVGVATSKLESVFTSIEQDRTSGIIAALVTLVILGVIIGTAIADEPGRIISLLGLVCFIGFTWLFSWKPRQVKWRPVLGGLLFQFGFGFLILRTTAGFNTFDFLGIQISALLDYTKAGSGFVFAHLATGPFGVSVFAFSVLPTVVFFSALVSILYHWGALQVVIRVIGKGMAFLLGTSGSESLSAAGNIFVGQTEAPLLIRPFLKDMTESEIHAVMTGGFATIAGGVLAIFISFEIDAPSLLSASVMSAPAALAISKLAYPETEESKTAAGVEYEIDVGDDVNVIEAASKGAAIATQLAINIAGQLVGFLALIAMFDAFLLYFGVFIGIDNLSFGLISSYVFYPVAFLMGVDADDCLKVGEMIGSKVFVNEFVAYLDLQANIASDAPISKRSQIVATYALCGFSNFGSIGIQLGGLTPLAPNQGKVMAKVVFSAMVAGNVACFMTACVAGLLYKEQV